MGWFNVQDSGHFACAVDQGMTSCGLVHSQACCCPPVRCSNILCTMMDSWSFDRTNATSTAARPPGLDSGGTMVLDLLDQAAEARHWRPNLDGAYRSSAAFSLLGRLAWVGSPALPSPSGATIALDRSQKVIRVNVALTRVVIKATAGSCGHKRRRRASGTRRH
jgi:hypothetical protein